MDEQTAQFYEQRAADVATRYENVASPIAATLMRLLFAARACSILVPVRAGTAHVF